LLTITDYIVLIVVSLSTFNGWRRGFLRSLLGPLSLVLCSVLSFVYFQKTHNLFWSLLLCVLGPLLLNILLPLLLKIGQKTAPEDKSISSSSRILGALFNLSWNTGTLILFLVWILMLPANVFGLAKIHSDINGSMTISLLNQLLPNYLPLVDHFQNTWRVLNDPKERKMIESSPEYTALSQDEKIQGILADQDLIDQIRRGEMAKILSNPKIQEIFQDKELIKKFLALENSILRKRLPRSIN